jgi:5-hydroxyisourate hydrolase
MMGRITTHVLDTSNGKPGAGMKLEFSVFEGQGWKLLKTLTTNKDGRTDEPLADGELQPGQYRIVFHVATYFRSLGTKLDDPPFLDRVPLRFGIAHASAHYHVPLLCSPWGYTTYRGS